MTIGHVQDLAEEKDGRLNLHAISTSVSWSHSEQGKLSVIEAEKAKWTDGYSKNFPIIYNLWLM